MQTETNEKWKHAFSFLAANRLQPLCFALPANVIEPATLAAGLT
jgi:hypothetical protein